MKIAIFGASGFAREVRDIAYILGYTGIVFIEKKKEKYDINDFTIVEEDKIYTLSQQGYKFIIGIGNTKIRKEVRDKYPNLDYINLIHPTATFGYKQLAILNNKIGNIIFAGARITNNIEVGDFGIYYLNCTVAHDCIIEDFVTICPGANISGNVKLSIGAYIGANACILQGRSITEKMIIGKYATVAAGSVVTKNVLDHKIVKGVPAK